jgi:hypothetical protein
VAKSSEEKGPEKVVITDPSKSDVVKAARIVIRDQTGVGRVPNIALRIHSDPESFNAIKEHFEVIKDKDGVSMAEICRKYWLEKQRA